MIEIRSAIWLNAEHTAANCEVFAEALNAWVPYTVSKNHLTGDAVAQEVWEALKSAVVQEPAPEPDALKIARARLVRDGYLKDTDVRNPCIQAVFTRPAGLRAGLVSEAYKDPC